MKETWRWFGPQDPIPLDHIKQAGATGIVTALHHFYRGEAWPLQEVLKRREEIAAAGFDWSVVESIPIHNSIKLRSGRHQHLRRRLERQFGRSRQGWCAQPFATTSCRWSIGPEPTCNGVCRRPATRCALTPSILQHTISSFCSEKMQRRSIRRNKSARRKLFQQHD